MAVTCNKNPKQRDLKSCYYELCREVCLKIYRTQNVLTISRKSATDFLKLFTMQIIYLHRPLKRYNNFVHHNFSSAEELLVKVRSVHHTKSLFHAIFNNGNSA